MKKWLVLILLIITTAGTFIPCCAIDSCCADQLATSASHEQHNSEGTCSPFFACATCPGFVELLNPARIIHPAVAKQIHEQGRITFTLATYAASFWQPPRFYHVLFT